MSFKKTLFASLAVFAGASVKEKTEDGNGLMFAELDMNKDGFLSLSEYSGITDEQEHDMEPEELGEMKKDAKQNFDKLDRDKDGKLTQEEMAKEVVEPPAPPMDEPPAEQTDERPAPEESQESFAPEESHVAAVEEVADAYGTEQDSDEISSDQLATELMDERDGDQDGQLSFEEFLGGMDDVEEDEQVQFKQDIQVDFKKADKNSDGKVSMDELKAFLEAGPYDEEPKHKA
eukprot:TRINITY_DN1891_c0_g1_i6.p1 TRINITY_DN1891_c0_g1~~TRINITY_DN1891_c0_g1_i6.p1  ORF type:complete len:232 (+),score=84.73 TRINITY_DN1891_c0_g1_i6:56-751(+)